MPARLSRAENPLTAVDDAGSVDPAPGDSPSEDLIRAARVLAGHRRKATGRRAGAELDLLTPREQDVLRALGRGLTAAEIATALALSETTVEGHIGQLVARLGLGDWAAAIVYAAESAPANEPSVESVGLSPAVRVPSLSVVPRIAPDPRLRLAVLGPLRASFDGDQVDLGPARQQALLAALVLRPDVTLSRRELLDAVWGMDQPGAKVVPVYVYRLRKCLRPGDSSLDSVIGRDRGGYRFARSGVQLDLTRVEELVAEADVARRAGDLAAAVDVYTSALGLFRGEPLAGLPGPFAEGERRRLVERRIALLQEKLEWQVCLGRHSEAIGELSALTSAHTYNESLAALLMRALYDSGRRADALAVFTRVRRRLVDDLGVEPSELLRRAHLALLRDDDIGVGAARAKTVRPAGGYVKGL